MAEAASQETMVVFRPMVRADRGFFASNWLRSFERAPANAGIASETFFYFHHRVLERLLERSKVVMACDRRDPDLLFGFACFEQLASTCLLHYVFVKKRRRGIGIGSALLSESLRACRPEPSALVWTHRTKGFDRWVRRFTEREKRDLALLYNPYLIDEAYR